MIKKKEMKETRPKIWVSSANQGKRQKGKTPKNNIKHQSGQNQKQAW